MKLKNYIYVKKEKFSRFLALKFSRNRSFTAMQFVLKTLQANKMLPEKLFALELFGFIGTSVAMDYQHLAEYLELWELNPGYAREAQKNIPMANVVCGNSIKAIKEGQLQRKEYNFIVIDPNSNEFDDGSFESFSVFEPALKHLANEAVIVVTIYNNLKNFSKLYNSEIDPNWISARKAFYSMDNVLDARGIDYLTSFENLIRKNNMKVEFSQFLSRNECVGFGIFVIKKNI
jgi:hypothetical protein